MQLSSDTSTLKDEEESVRIKKIVDMAKLGISESAIASHFGMNPEELTAAYGQQIAYAKMEVNEQVLQALFAMATSGKNLSATLFWIKLHCGHLLPAVEPTEDSAKSKSTKKEYVWDPNDPNDRVKFTVYNNDGEPNADY